MNFDGARRSFLVLVQLAVLTGCGAKTIVLVSDDGDAGEVVDSGTTDGALTDSHADSNIEDTATVADTGPVACAMEGETETVPCGKKCGTQTRICSGGMWVASKCTDKGECAAGEFEAITCPSGVPGKRTCTASCTWESSCTAPPLDIVLLLDTTGSLMNLTNPGNKAALMDEIVTPLLASKAFDVHVGVVEFKDLGDMPFLAGRAVPTGDAATIQAAINALSSSGGGDIQEGLVPALAEMAGGKPHAGSTPLTCTTGTSLGGCFRNTAQKVVVVVSDALQHNAPDGSGGIIAPYMDATESWATVAGMLKMNAINVFALTDIPSKQMWAAMEIDLGASPPDRVMSGDMNGVADWSMFYSGLYSILQKGIPGL